MKHFSASLKQPLIKPITAALIFICCSLMLISNFATFKLRDNMNEEKLAIFLSPVDKAFLYDYPLYYELIGEYLQTYKDDPKSAEAQQLLFKINDTPVWTGIYSLALPETPRSFILGEKSSFKLFEKIREGQIWRLFTPALLHTDIFHLFFNMLWLIVLGRQIEQRLPAFSYIAFILIIGIFSNTIQYLVGGPNFVGFSGVLCGMLTFVKQRQQSAPWESYELPPSTYRFMMLFIYGMAALQILLFFIEISSGLTFPLHLANSAHLSGAFLGHLLGKTEFFKWTST